MMAVGTRMPTVEHAPTGWVSGVTFAACCRICCTAEQFARDHGDAEACWPGSQLPVVLECYVCGRVVGGPAGPDPDLVV
jgi:hypothetical protein